MDWELRFPVLQRQIKKQIFFALGIVYTYGTVYYTNGIISNLANREYVKKVFNGETNISDIFISKVANQPVPHQ
ncbi:methyl-accepting chemotaxis protein [Caminicella sporogenes DSM 14501]|uniref:Methyl-accepting chemotaxis protein n=1 Tax=Caminicella sporogenes DSM 14501 TaxID=1121266 RepID=A0A1M6TRQ8_9FIRM|nr:hypothetical protein [Caminicella sporogenes]RKD24754.1 hypothetical protein BET04_11935 [Caminicella sporogenes]SHK59610.1 methyl-accepting chemotaxis protein [Caminicella sporogenes DSM 14501]